MTAMRPEKGTYALLLYLAQGRAFADVGPFGTINLPAGHYLYVGSAHGSGGARGRVGHHLRPRRRAFVWHLDYVRPAMRAVEAWVTYDPRQARVRVGEIDPRGAGRGGAGPRPRLGRRAPVAPAGQLPGPLLPLRPAAAGTGRVAAAGPPPGRPGRRSQSAPRRPPASWGRRPSPAGRRPGGSSGRRARPGPLAPETFLTSRRFSCTCPPTLRQDALARSTALARGRVGHHLRPRRRALVGHAVGGPSRKAAAFAVRPAGATGQAGGTVVTGTRRRPGRGSRELSAWTSATPAWPSPGSTPTKRMSF
jgi:hypothetical protein